MTLHKLNSKWVKTLIIKPNSLLIEEKMGNGLELIDTAIVYEQNTISEYTNIKN